MRFLGVVSIAITSTICLAQRAKITTSRKARLRHASDRGVKYWYDNKPYKYISNNQPRMATAKPAGMSFSIPISRPILRTLTASQARRDDKNQKVRRSQRDFHGELVPSRSLHVHRGCLTKRVSFLRVVNARLKRGLPSLTRLLTLLLRREIEF